MILDYPTRWCSLLAIPKRFSVLRPAIEKTVIDVSTASRSKSKVAHLAEADFQIVTDIVSTLEPIGLVINILSRRDTNLVSAEAAI